MMVSIRVVPIDFLFGGMCKTYILPKKVGKVPMIVEEYLFIKENAMNIL